MTSTRFRFLDAWNVQPLPERRKVLAEALSDEHAEKWHALPWEFIPEAIRATLTETYNDEPAAEVCRNHNTLKPCLACKPESWKL